MSELRELYQETILDHSKHPRNFGLPDGGGQVGEGYNPLCGDRLTVKVRMEEGVVTAIGFTGSGCAISQAAASTMTEAVKGLSAADIEALFARYHALVTGEDGEADLDLDLDELGRLAVFGGVSEFPMRVKCATLAWHTLREALAGRGQLARTEE
ncbi:MAG TPA: SUF system NifU family Fe-S cluster assembly protein [Kofleriaceae bacterium]|nr:SUF system NifU family Fe-S cluster assembly protein [Kofleriaceae bacterium]